MVNLLADADLSATGTDVEEVKAALCGADGGADRSLFVNSWDTEKAAGIASRSTGASALDCRRAGKLWLVGSTVSVDPVRIPRS